MLFFKPTVDEQNENSVLFEALQDTEKLGECRLVLKKDVADVNYISCTSLITAQGLLKSAYNYAANRGYYIATFSAECCEDIKGALKFENCNGVLTNDIPTLLAGNCKC